MRRLRTEILAELDRLAHAPFADPGLEETSPVGRRFAIRVRERIILTHWVDHAVNTARVICVEIY